MRGLGLYRLRGKEVEPCYSLEEWARLFERCDREVAETQFDGGEVWVSTLFLGIDTGFDPRPILFETRVYGSQEEMELFGIRPELPGTRRYGTWAEAEAGHAEVVAEVERSLSRSRAIATEAIEKLQSR